MIREGPTASDGQRQSSAVHNQVVDVMRFVISQGGDFSVHEAAAALGQEHSQVGTILCHLHKLNLIQSNSSAYLKGGRVLVI